MFPYSGNILPEEKHKSFHIKIFFLCLFKANIQQAASLFKDSTANAGGRDISLGPGFKVSSEFS